MTVLTQQTGSRNKPTLMSPQLDLHSTHMAVRLHHFHYCHFYLLSLVHSFILNWILSTIDIPLTYRTDSTDSLPIQHFYSAQRLDLFVQCVRLNRLSVGFQTHSNSLQLHSITTGFMTWSRAGWLPRDRGQLRTLCLTVRSVRLAYLYLDLLMLL